MPKARLQQLDLLTLYPLVNCSKNLCKAFDSVPHQPLLCKLFNLQVNPFLFRWIHSYLSSRTQSVVLDGAQSDPLPVVSGVPQGSVLGLLLFLVYIDGASNTVLHGKIAMYTDDIALYSIIKNHISSKGYYLSVFLVSYQPSDPKPYKVLLHAFL